MVEFESKNSMPPVVARGLGFFERHGIWCRVSRNTPATSCRDAAFRRNRLGHKGIPLHDELRSLCVVAYTLAGERVFVMLHCRGDARFDLERAAHRLGVERPLARLSEEELLSRFSAIYGTVNPFCYPQAFRHLFDTGVLSDYPAPNTMMTNLGDHTWAVEFRPQDVVSTLGQECLGVDVGEIVEGNNRYSAQLPVFGILTGNGPESGMALWRNINHAVFTHLTEQGRMYGDLSFPRIHIHSVPEMGLSMELVKREERVRDVVLQGIKSLCDSGANTLALACHTTHYFTDAIRDYCHERGTRFVSMVEVVMAHLETLPPEQITLIGIPSVADLGPFSPYHVLSGCCSHLVPVNESALPYIQELGYLVKKNDENHKALNKLAHVMRVGVSGKIALAALTEISVLLERFPRNRNQLADKKLIDALALYGDHLAQIYLAALPVTTLHSSSEE